MRSIMLVFATRVRRKQKMDFKPDQIDLVFSIENTSYNASGKVIQGGVAWDAFCIPKQKGEETVYRLVVRAEAIHSVTGEKKSIRIVMSEPEVHQSEWEALTLEDAEDFQTFEFDEVRSWKDPWIVSVH